MAVEGEQSLAVDQTGDCSICMESLHWDEGAMFIWYREELGLAATLLARAECCHGALGGHVFVLLSCRRNRAETSQQGFTCSILAQHHR